ncbi:MAG: ribosome-associated translation inhibitor RaiA [Chitinivibrionales bacterium]|nr:ribosome-associated translation inhibitor RaiA [Chitinivibrionales bacterium]
MEVQITYRHSKASDGMKESIRSDVEKLEKFHEKITSCRVIIDEESISKKVEIVIHVQNHVIKAVGKAENLGKAFDQALGKAERQLKKINKKIKEHKGVKSGRAASQRQRPKSEGDEFDEELE